MLLKRTNRNKDGYIPDYAAFNVPDEYVVGDINEFFRDLDHVCVLNPAGVKKFHSKNLEKEGLGEFGSRPLWLTWNKADWIIWFTNKSLAT